MREWWINQQRNKKVSENTKEGVYANRQKHQTFYQSRQWQSLRLYKLSIDPLCEECLKQGLTEPATEIDHIIALQDNWSLRLSLDSLQSLCRSHHSKKTIQEGVDRRKKEQQNMIDDRMDSLNIFEP
jgi:5-methylcytosine-specific restriction protein A